MSDQLWIAIVGGLALVASVTIPLLHIGRRSVRTAEAIEHELKPNSGGSLRDAVDRIEAVLPEIGKALERVDATTARNTRELVNVKRDQTRQDSALAAVTAARDDEMREILQRLATLAPTPDPERPIP
ncbi:hypothetical protein SAMN04515671_2909 [Nakamurella panacisegetis]|uniref:Uncharacterized protein n=1 Tax=Nakamurella panacisegetis TaxID=1090615 RepID=A0A1H0PUQ6_9ACTN|nr:hypothetical protein [Nakamurella panacisegetis]SDP08813.1 hypothetical protein SAMN04515671_2909 [Nakamurella panacisegetis]